jgi:hypothetical protein
MWPIRRAEELTQMAKEVFAKPCIRYTFIPSEEASFINYFSAKAINELSKENPEHFECIPPNHSLGCVDIIIASCL